MVWKHEAVFTVKTMWSEGKSASVIAEKLTEMFGIKFTRNMVIGKVHRLIDAGKMLARGDKKPVSVKPKEVKAERKAAKLVSQSIEAADTVPPVSLGDNVIMFVPLKKKPVGNGVTLENVSGCLYATGVDHRNRHLFCNSTRREGSSYCEEHHAKCIIPLAPKVKKPPEKWYPY